MEDDSIVFDAWERIKELEGELAAANAKIAKMIVLDPASLDAAAKELLRIVATYDEQTSWQNAKAIARGVLRNYFLFEDMDPS